MIVSFYIIGDIENKYKSAFFKTKSTIINGMCLDAF